MKKELSVTSIWFVVTVLVGLIFAFAALGLITYVTLSITHHYIDQVKDIPGGINTFYGILAGTCLTSMLGVWKGSRRFLTAFAPSNNTKQMVQLAEADDQTNQS